MRPPHDEAPAVRTGATTGWLAKAIIAGATDKGQTPGIGVF